MFKLQRLEITGFKSFADYTEIVFTGNGITAVVGPNGCGKSNVSDAISWVLGEQRAKSLRGGEMKDVVFQGTKNRKPSGMAEVVLHLVRDEDAFDVEDQELEDIDETLNELDEHAVDFAAIEGDEPAVEAVGIETEISTNGFHEEEVETEIVQAAQVGSIQTVQTKVKTKRHWRPRSFALDFAPGEAVSVTRRLYLSGESEYQLNGKTCRLRDIQDLFAGTGLSGSHYAIIEQGRIGQILSAKPADRRNLIEEAAGISKFRTRQRAAEARLETAKTNLGRVSDIVSEIESRVNSLRRQAGKTRRYKILQEEFRVLMRQFYAAEGRYLSGLIEELDVELENASESERELLTKIEDKEKAFRESTQNARMREEALAELRRAHAENALERDRAEREHRYQSEQVVNLHNRIESLRAEITATETRLAIIGGEHAKLEKEEQQERESAGQAELTFRDSEASYQAKVEIVNGIESRLEAARGELLQHTAAVERFSEVSRQLTTNLARLNERVEGLAREAARAETSHNDYGVEAETLVQTISGERKKLGGLQEEKQAILAQTAKARNELRAVEADFNAIKDEFSRKQNRLETLQELEEKRAVYAPQVQRLFAAQDEIGVRLAGVLADRLNVNPRAEKAVESLFGPYLETVLVQSLDDARKISAWLKENDVGRTAVLVVAEEDEQIATSELGIEKILGIGGRLAAALREVFPREMSAKFVDKFGEDTGENQLLVNADGDMLLGGRLLISGKLRDDAENASLLAFKRELYDLKSETADLSAEIAAAASRVDQAGAALAEKEEKTVDLQSLIIKIERGLHGLEIQEQSARQEIERAERHRKVVADEIQQVKSECVDIEGRIAEAASNAQIAEDRRAETALRMEEITRELNDSRLAAENEAAVLNEKRTLAATSSERSRSAQSALRRIENEEKELESRLAIQNLEMSEADTKIHNLRGSIEGIADRLASAESDIAAEQAEVAAAIELLTSTRGEADKMNEELADLNRQSADAINNRGGIEIRQAETVTHLKNINERCTQELNASLKMLVETEEIAPDFVLDDARIAADDLRHRLENFGAVNMLAVDELAEAEERHLFLTSQRQDIIDSIATAEEALREIKERSREKFRHAFEAINANFMQFFQELFGGGHGLMSLLESDDILEAGIEVAAQPPGKRLQNILLLSGGEKAMTAIALVLAIFKYRPSPFCLLDEVDAPLDDANVGRFVNKIADMSEKTQFIVITHNKRTMEAARALYGVTMQEAGVSKIVSVKFD